jgi:hypothetical protein
LYKSFRTNVEKRKWEEKKKERKKEWMKEKFIKDESEFTDKDKILDIFIHARIAMLTQLKEGKCEERRK